MKRQVVVTGLGAITPLGLGARTLYERWRAGASGIEDGEDRCGAQQEHQPERDAREPERAQLPVAG